MMRKKEKDTTKKTSKLKDNEFPIFNFQFSVFNSALEKVAKVVLTLSGSITSLAILLIVIFLFKEGFGLFKSPAVEKGYALCVNSSNSIEHLTPFQIKEIFDGEITEWKVENGKLKVDSSSFHLSVFTYL